jgi:hypothetical protein
MFLNLLFAIAFEDGCRFQRAQFRAEANRAKVVEGSLAQIRIRRIAGVKPSAW